MSHCSTMQCHTAQKRKRKYVVDECVPLGVLEINFFFEGETMSCDVHLVQDNLAARFFLSNASKRGEEAEENRQSMMVHRPFSTYVRVFKVTRQDDCWIGVLALDLMFTLFVRDNKRSDGLSKVVLEKEARTRIVGLCGHKIFRIIGLSEAFSYIKCMKPRNKEKIIMKCALLNNVEKFVNIFDGRVKCNKKL